MSPELFLRLAPTLIRLGFQVIGKMKQKPVKELTDEDFLQWLDEYEDAMISTDDLMPDPEDLRPPWETDP